MAFGFQMGGRRIDQAQVDALQEGKIVIQRCIDCKTLVQPPRPICPNCHSLDRDWLESSGKGVVYAWVAPVHGVPPVEDPADRPIVVLVDLEEGARMMSGLKDVAIEDVRNGMAVEARFNEDEDGEKWVTFHPLAEEVKTEPVIRPDFHPVPSSRFQKPKEVLWDRVAISGIGQTEFSKDSGRPVIQLAAEASLAAIRDAGLTPADIDGMVTFTGDQNQEIVLCDTLGIPEITWEGRAVGGGMASTSVVQLAAAAVISGAATNVLIYRAFNERSEQRFGQPMAGGARPPGRPKAARFLNTPAGMYSLWWQRYMHEYGVTNEDFAHYSVVARKHAATNPNAWFYNRPITLEDHQNSRWIVEPVIRLLDCCQESDGGVAMVVTSAERAADAPNPAVKLISAGQGYAGKNGGGGLGYFEGDLSRFADCRVSGRQAFRDAGMGPDDIDVAMIYENFTPLVFVTLEELGFCGPGEAKDFIREGNIEIGGKLPVNTHGGLLGEAYIHGVNNVLEAVRQLRGTAANQVENCETAMVANGVGTLIFGKA
jgi:acetyl-CoA acetyltransferase/uncharacterized OB-fold protein